VIFAGLTAIATLAAAATAILGPYISANLQRKHTKEMVERDTKLRIFGVLMGYRERWGQREAVQALNLIDIVWINTPQVRRAWHDFYRATQAQSGYGPSQQRDAYQRLLERMAEDLGFAGEFRSDDYARVFYSNAVHWEDEARMRQNYQMAFPAQTNNQASEPPDAGQS